MLAVRIIPILLLRNEGLVKGSKFVKHRYLGDPMNAVRIFNEKEVDELVFLDIGATPQGLEPNFDYLRDIASEAFMPFGYGGGITSCQQIERLFYLGVEKIILNSVAVTKPELVTEASRIAGAQSIVVSIDCRRSLFGRYEVCIDSGATRVSLDPVTHAKRMCELGAGEIILCNIDREGTGKGYDLKLIEEVSEAVDIPVVAVGGAAKLDHFRSGYNAGASALAAGDMFVFHGRHKAVLITYPSQESIFSALGDCT